MLRGFMSVQWNRWDRPPITGVSPTYAVYSAHRPRMMIDAVVWGLDWNGKP